ncbi:hypothetical protein [Mycoplasma crocodyli]|uniref:Uncharacterized protein n=1 Tax=Mycoplasma crocodyli (strain ATCC 51981 / MP145) TaxID=512564 RepID=D5E5A2_MYCCM|nr:hypothetical protein [Mycoplasma crocodyli]ADE19625.1 conserved hypothetical protein [Mycoplasma crocodyli MP145]
MFKKTNIFFKIISTFLLTIIMLLVSFSGIDINKKEIYDQRFIINVNNDEKVFDSRKDILKYFMKNNIVQNVPIIGEKKYKNEYNELQIDNDCATTLENKKLHPAYKEINSGYVHSPQMAALSYIPEYAIVKRYEDNLGNKYREKDAAIESMKKYDKKLLFKNAYINFDNNFYNPFIKEDVNNFINRVVYSDNANNIKKKKVIFKNDDKYITVDPNKESEILNNLKNELKVNLKNILMENNNSLKYFKVSLFMDDAKNEISDFNSNNYSFDKDFAYFDVNDKWLLGDYLTDAFEDRDDYGNFILIYKKLVTRLYNYYSLNDLNNTIVGEIEPLEKKQKIKSLNKVTDTFSHDGFYDLVDGYYWYGQYFASLQENKNFLNQNKLEIKTHFKQKTYHQKSSLTWAYPATIFNEYRGNKNFGIRIKVELDIDKLRERFEYIFDRLIRREKKHVNIIFNELVSKINNKSLINNIIDNKNNKFTSEYFISEKSNFKIEKKLNDLEIEKQINNFFETGINSLNFDAKGFVYKFDNEIIAYRSGDEIVNLIFNKHLAENHLFGFDEEDFIINTNKTFMRMSNFLTNNEKNNNKIDIISNDNEYIKQYSIYVNSKINKIFNSIKNNENEIFINNDPKLYIVLNNTKLELRTSLTNIKRTNNLLDFRFFKNYNDETVSKKIISENDYLKTLNHKPKIFYFVSGLESSLEANGLKLPTKFLEFNDEVILVLNNRIILDKLLNRSMEKIYVELDANNNKKMFNLNIFNVYMLNINGNKIYFDDLENINKYINRYIDQNMKIKYKIKR